MFLNNIHPVKENVSIVKKKVFASSPSILLNFKQSFPILSVTKTKYLISGVVYKLQCGLCNESYYDQSIRHLEIRCREHIGVSRLSEGKTIE